MRVAAAGVPAVADAELPGRPVWLPARPARDALAEIAGALGAHDGDVVAIVPAWADDVVGRRLRTSASALERSVSVHVTTLPPLAATALSAVAAAIAPHARSGPLLAAALPRVEAELVPFALLRSVARLREPRPSLDQRLRSRLPGASFVASLAPEPVVRAPEDVLADEIVPPASAAALAVRPRGAWLAAELPAAVDAGEPPPESTAWWGSPPALEGVSWPRDLAALADRALPAAAVPCPWCAALTATLPCPRCGHDRNPQLGRVAA